MNTRNIEIELPSSHQRLLEDLATQFDINVDELVITLLELVGEVYLDAKYPTDKLTNDTVALLNEMYQNKEKINKLMEEKF